ncbi:MAG: DUF6948 domain-containing protein [Candidatus Dormibacteria bacterium]
MLGASLNPPEVTDRVAKYVIVRTAQAGAFAGYLKSREGSEVTLTNARRLWHWVGAATLSQMALTGPTKSGSKFPEAVPLILLLGVIEVIDASETARTAIEEVPVWRS